MNEKQLSDFVMWAIENDYLYLDKLEMEGVEINTTEDAIKRLVTKYYENK